MSFERKLDPQGNINPKYISIYIGGRVNSPGRKNISKTATLNEALAYAGGIKAVSGPLTFLRYNQDGTIDKRKFRINMRSPRGSKKNPYLAQGDLIYVGKSAFNISNEILVEVLSPLQNVITNYLLFDKIF